MQIIKDTRGYTLDQTILIVAIIAILITLIILTIGWTLLNRAGGTKLGAQGRQVEDAIGSFFGDNQIWPHEMLFQSGQSVATSNDPIYLTGMMVSADFLGSDEPSFISNHKNYLAGLKIEGSGTSSRTYHNFGRGGLVLVGNVDMTGDAGSRSIRTGNYYVVQFSNVPVTEASEAKESVDGDFEGDDTATQGGRITFRTATTDSSYTCDNSIQLDAATVAAADDVNVCYIAKLID